MLLADYMQILGVARAVSYLHGHGMVHNDIKAVYYSSNYPSCNHMPHIDRRIFSSKIISRSSMQLAPLGAFIQMIILLQPAEWGLKTSYGQPLK